MSLHLSLLTILFIFDNNCNVTKFFFDLIVHRNIQILNFTKTAIFNFHPMQKLKKN